MYTHTHTHTRTHTHTHTGVLLYTFHHCYVFGYIGNVHLALHSFLASVVVLLLLLVVLYFVCFFLLHLAAVNLSLFCLPTHRRGLNPPHRVKSISMTTFTQHEMEFLQKHTNEVCVSLSHTFRNRLCVPHARALRSGLTIVD